MRTACPASSNSMTATRTARAFSFEQHYDRDNLRITQHDTSSLQPSHVLQIQSASLLIRRLRLRL